MDLKNLGNIADRGNLAQKMLEKTILKVWDKISAEVDGFFLSRKMARYFRTGRIIKERVEEELNRRNIKYISKLVDDSECGWPKVSVNVFVDLEDFKQIMDLWDELSEIAYNGICDDQFMGCFLSVGTSKILAEHPKACMHEKM